MTIDELKTRKRSVNVIKGENHRASTSIYKINIGVCRYKVSKSHLEKQSRVLNMASTVGISNRYESPIKPHISKYNKGRINANETRKIHITNKGTNNKYIDLLIRKLEIGKKK